MNDSIKQLSLDFHQSSSREEVKIKKGDNKRQIRISLVDGGKPYRISEGCYAAMTGTKPDGKKLFNDCSIDGNTIVYKVTNQTSAVSGVVSCEVVLYDADDQRITSSKFAILVVDTEYTEGDDIESSDEVTFLTALIGDAVGAINNANTAAENANDVASDLLQAKEDGEFKGEKGDPGVPGEPGRSGVYILSSGESIEDAPADADVVIDPEGGATGEGGLPSLPGEKGDKGDPGEPGYTPVKGVDYWTEADQNEIVEEVLAQIPTGGGSGGGSWKLLEQVKLAERVQKLEFAMPSEFNEIIVVMHASGLFYCDADGNALTANQYINMSFNNSTSGDQAASARLEIPLGKDDKWNGCFSHIQVVNGYSISYSGYFSGNATSNKPFTRSNAINWSASKLYIFFNASDTAYFNLNLKVSIWYK